MSIELIYSIFSATLGLIIGSFLNVVIARLPEGRSIIKPGSSCPECKKPISWFDNIPVLSWLWLRAKCRNCKKSISFRYPCVEVLTGVLFLAAQIRFGWSWLLFIHDWPFIAILVAITFIDLDHRIIPDELSIGGMILGLATSWAVPEIGLIHSFVGAGVGFGVFYFFAWAYQRIRGQSGLGGGDIKLLGMLGAFLGLGGVFASILISSILGSIIGIAWALTQKRKNPDEKLMLVSIPYGPFMVIGGLYYYFLGDILWFQFTIPT